MNLPFLSSAGHGGSGVPEHGVDTREQLKIDLMSAIQEIIARSHQKGNYYDGEVDDQCFLQWAIAENPFMDQDSYCRYEARAKWKGYAQQLRNGELRTRDELLDFVKLTFQREVRCLLLTSSHVDIVNGESTNFEGNPALQDGGSIEWLIGIYCAVHRRDFCELLYAMDNPPMALFRTNGAHSAFIMLYSGLR
ncbi:MAG: hypothetical protein QY318_04760 [Candidatus Dojkabacteria bacterium]|nr:MAG: hypothetical protein QY318_04760 [Candidatus Dojkabacteria bacterium]